MTTPINLTRALTIGAIALLGLTAMACTPEEEVMFRQAMAVNQEKAQLAARSTGGLSDAGLARLRNCESRGNYRAVSSSGSYRGAYQFTRSTWNNVARTVMPSYVGVDPAAAPSYVQDAMARALWSRTGARSWPVCGRRV